MRKRIQPGPEPWRKRLGALDADTIAAGAKNLVLYARGEDAPLTVPARVLVEAVQTAYDAARAREYLSRALPVPPRWLAALAGVDTSRIRQLVRDRVLERRDGGVDAASAQRWLALEHVRAPVTTHVLNVTPSWWDDNPSKLSRMKDIEAVVAELAPAGCRVQYGDWWRPYVRVPVSAGLDAEAAKELRRAIVERIEPLAPELPAGMRRAIEPEPARDAGVSTESAS